MGNALIRGIIDINLLLLGLKNDVGLLIVDKDSFVSEKSYASAVFMPNRKTKIIIRRDFYGKYQNDKNMIAIVISHECRHIWQYRMNGAKQFTDYEKLDELSVSDYNKQEAEKDAWAWCVAFCEVFLGITPIFGSPNDDKETHLEIKRRARRLKNDILKSGIL